MNICITNEYNKTKLLELNTSKKQINNNKYYTFQEFKKKRFFDYNYKTIEYIITKYNVNINIAKIYLNNLYFLNNLDNPKIKFLFNLKKELDENKLLIYNPSFNEYIVNKKIYIYINNELNNEEKRILEGLDYEIITSNKSNYKPSVYMAKTIEEEILFTVTKIKELLQQNIDINKIKLIVNNSYNKHLLLFFDLFQIPINIKSNNSLYATSLAKKFLKKYDDNDPIDLIEKYKDEKLINDLIKVYNKSVLIEDKSIRKIFFINDLKNTYITDKVYKNAIEISSTNEAFDNDTHVFWLGLNITDYPKIKKDDDYLSDREKELLNLDTSIELNKLEKNKIINLIKNTNNLTITYASFDGTNTKYPSTIIEELNLTPEPISIDQHISYSKTFSNLCYANALDNLYKYNDIDKNLILYQNNLNIKYKEYNNKYFKIDTSILKESLNNSLTLSYTSLEEYNECNFKYYLSRILALNIYEETFKILIGKIMHHILEKGINNNIDIEEEISIFLKNNDYHLNAKELFYIHKIAKESKFLLDYLNEEKKHSKLNNFELEKNINIEKIYKDITINFQGFIDKVMSTNYNQKEVIAVVDYKTGDKNIKLDTLEYGINIQLPIYLYLLKKSTEYKDSIIAGFYIERILNNPLNINKKKTLEDEKKENLRLQGYTNSNEEIIALLDDEYKDSKMIKGLRFKKDGSFYSTSKVLNDNEMNDLINKVDLIIDDAIKNIISANFSINPKVINGKNISCTYCKYKDICFMTKEDEISLGGAKDELN